MASALEPRLDVRVLVVQNGIPGPAIPGSERLALPENRGFAGGMNAGVRRAAEQGCDRFLLLNNDAQAEPDWVGACVEALIQSPERGSVASKVLYDDRRTINSAGDSVGRDGVPYQRGNGEQD